MQHPRPLGRHEHGQNFLTDPTVPAALAAVVAGWEPRPLLELGAGDGALTAALSRLPADRPRPLTAVELDPYRVARLRERFGDTVRIRRGDLVWEPLDRPVDVVSNVPFGLTTPLLRRLLGASHWAHALLLLQWEVARKRAAVGGTTALTARWWPWYEFRLLDRVPARAFRPVPSVDAGVLEIVRRDTPLVTGAPTPYQRLVDTVFTGRGRGVVDVVGRRYGRVTAARWAASSGIGRRALPRDLGPAQWADLAARVTRACR
ncbi:ribosomal RNA small subunit methyltransferase A [Pseudonocardia nantongensis]|uniref:ribosomal RNA small subunit methyltransferase A n=1 Tax=Pseudonocardia nantongensis TaxID=1181885 RepID=UPI00397B632F